MTFQVELDWHFKPFLVAFLPNFTNLSGNFIELVIVLFLLQLFIVIFISILVFVDQGLRLFVKNLRLFLLKATMVNLVVTKDSQDDFQ